MATGAAIETVGLSKTYTGNVQALSGLDVRVELGEVFGYLGPNGSGKSTTIRLLTGSLRPTAGTAAVFGIDTSRRAVVAHRRIGYLPGDLRLADSLTGDEQLDSRRQHVANRVGIIRSGRLTDVDCVERLRERFTATCHAHLRRPG